MNWYQALKCALDGAWSTFRNVYLGCRAIPKESLAGLEKFEFTTTVFLKEPDEDPQPSPSST